LLLFNGGVVDFFDEAERFFVACFIAVAFQLPLWFDRLTTNGIMDNGTLTTNGCWDVVRTRRKDYRN
jgi:hypothetical protein